MTDQMRVCAGEAKFKCVGAVKYRPPEHKWYCDRHYNGGFTR